MIYTSIMNMKEGLKNYDKMKKIMNCRIIKSYKQAPNLKSILCKSEFTRKKQGENSNKSQNARTQNVAHVSISRNPDQ